MPRAIWSGSISFGLVNIPVKLFSAVSHKEVHFHMLHRADGARIELRRFCSAEGREVPYEEIVKGYEVTPSRYVTVSPEDLQSVDPKATRTIDIHAFVEQREIDPIYYESTYYLAPDRGAAKAYGLLLDAMRRSGKVGLSTFVLRTKQYLCSLRPLENALALTTMNHADEIVSPEGLGLPARTEPPSERELAMAEQLVESLSTRFEPGKYPDTYREQVLELIDKKAQGQEVVAAPAEQPAQIVNLADALAASLSAARKGPRSAPPPERGERRHRAEAAQTVPARKRSRKREDS